MTAAKIHPAQSPQRSRSLTVRYLPDVVVSPAAPASEKRCDLRGHLRLDRLPMIAPAPSLGVTFAFGKTPEP